MPTTPLYYQAQAHIALAASADEIVGQFAAKMIEIAASEAALRSAYVAAYPGSATFAKDGMTNLASYMVTLAERIREGDARPDFIKPVADLALAAWSDVA